MQTIPRRPRSGTFAPCHIRFGFNEAYNLGELLCAKIVSAFELPFGFPYPWSPAITHLTPVFFGHNTELPDFRDCLFVLFDNLLNFLFAQ